MNVPVPDRRKSLPGRVANRRKIMRLSLGALFVSLSIILTRYASINPFPTIRIGFGPLPIQIAGIILGPVSGALVGLVADPLGFVMNPQGVYHLGFTLTSVLNGLIPGLIAMGLNRMRSGGKKKKVKSKTFWIALCSTLIITAICSILLNTLWLSMLLGTDYLTLMAARLPAVLASAAVHMAVLVIVLPALNRAGASRISRLKQA